MSEQCKTKKMGEFNDLRCCRESGHTGEHNYVIDHERALRDSATQDAKAGQSASDGNGLNEAAVPASAEPGGVKEPRAVTEMRSGILAGNFINPVLNHIDSLSSRLRELEQLAQAMFWRLNPSIEHVEGVPVGYGEDEIDRLNAALAAERERSGELEQANARLRGEIEKVESRLGVPDTRSKYLRGKLDVVLTRMQKAIDMEREARNIAESQLAACRSTITELGVLRLELEEAHMVQSGMLLKAEAELAACREAREKDKADAERYR